MYTVQYIVVRKDLAERLGAGVIATQVAHAAVAPITGQLRADLARPIAEALDEAQESLEESESQNSELESTKRAITNVMEDLQLERDKAFSFAEDLEKFKRAA
jgi:peptidyl-tRNA hydrolase